jgi:hypothetical protein
VVDLCEHLVKEVQVKIEEDDRLSPLDWSSQDAIFAVFFIILKTIGVKTLDKDRTELGVGTRKYSFNVKMIENLGDLLLKSIKETMKKKSNGKILESAPKTTLVSKKKKKRYVTGSNPMVHYFD